MIFSTELEQINLKFIWNHKRPKTTKVILRKKNKAKGITLLGFRLNYRATVIKNSTELAQKQTHSSMEQNREPRNKPTHLWLTNRQRGGKNIQWRWDSIFNK